MNVCSTFFYTHIIFLLYYFLCILEYRSMLKIKKVDKLFVLILMSAYMFICRLDGMI